MNQAPCKDCKDRKLKCHGSCTLYLDWLVEKRKATQYLKEQIALSRKYENDIQRCR